MTAAAAMLTIRIFILDKINYASASEFSLNSIVVPGQHMAKSCKRLRTCFSKGLLQ